MTNLNRYNHFPNKQLDKIVRVKRTVFSVTSEKMKVLHSVEYFSNAANEVLKLNENNREANREASLYTTEAIFDDLFFSMNFFF